MKIVFIISIFLLNQFFSSAQGLEGIVVETYYITDKSDAAYSGLDRIAPNSVTYRIFVDMKPGYNLQSVYGSPGHALTLSTNTFFFNHPEHGNYIPNLVLDRNLEIGTVMLDSWISVGAGSQQHFAILKSDDDSLNTIKNSLNPPVLQSEDGKAGIPIKIKDGLFKHPDLPPRLTQVGIDSLFTLLDKTTSTGTGVTFSTNNGGWGCVGGAKGADSEKNHVCIGQFTTNGDFNFEFNIQIGSPEHGVEQYVARNPIDREQLHSGLIISIPSSSKKTKVK